MAPQQEIRKINIKYINSTHEEEVSVFVYGPKGILIPYEELIRLAEKYQVPRPKMVFCDSAKDTAYWQQNKRFSVPSHEMYQHVLRYAVIFGAEVGDHFYSGEGSAGADNIEKWQIKSYSFEMACKRAKARFYKEVFGITEYLTDSEVGAGALDKFEPAEAGEETGPSNEADQPPDFMQTGAKTDPATENQKIAIFNVIKKIYSEEPFITVQHVMDAFGKVEHANDWWLDFATHNSKLLDTTSTYAGIEIKLPDAQEVFGFMDSPMASEFLSKLGNFSSTTVKPKR